MLLLIKSSAIFAQPVFKDSIINEKLLYHAIHLDPTDNKILPWYSNNLGKSYDYIINKINF